MNEDHQVGIDQDQRLATSILAGNRRAIAQGITLLESSRDKDQEAALLLLKTLPAVEHQTLRLGITGSPGAGKSTLIEALGCLAVDEGQKVAVLATDPSSPLQGGSILADKTRMRKLSQKEGAFIRPSPSGAGALGGLRASTGECIHLLEAAGFSSIFIETVGVGQSEKHIGDFVDLVMTVLPPLSGDDLQAMKRGLLEVSDILVVTKADGTHILDAQQTAGYYSQALRDPEDRVWTISAHTGLGVAELWAGVKDLMAKKREAHLLMAQRQRQSQKQLEIMILEQFRQKLIQSKAFKAVQKNMGDQLPREIALSHAVFTQLIKG